MRLQSASVLVAEPDEIHLLVGQVERQRPQRLVVVRVDGVGPLPYAEPHVRWCERTVNTKIGDKHL